MTPFRTPATCQSHANDQKGVCIARTVALAPTPSPARVARPSHRAHALLRRGSSRRGASSRWRGFPPRAPNLRERARDRVRRAATDAARREVTRRRSPSGGAHPSRAGEAGGGEGTKSASIPAWVCHTRCERLAPVGGQYQWSRLVFVARAIGGRVVSGIRLPAVAEAGRAAPEPASHGRQEEWLAR